MNTLNLNAGNIGQDGFFISSGDGKGVPVTSGFNMVKIPEKKVGKGKGKTVAYCIIPDILYSDLTEKETTAKLAPVMEEILKELQRDIIIRMQRDSIAAVTPTDIGIDSCVAEWTNRTFSAETVGAWFDNEVAELLSYHIIVARNLDAENLTEKQQAGIETRISAYRASYVETASKFPTLNPAQCAELIRVVDLLELAGPIVSRIRDKIVPKPVNASLGFGE